MKVVPLTAMARKARAAERERERASDVLRSILTHRAEDGPLASCRACVDVVVRYGRIAAGTALRAKARTMRAAR